MVNEIPGGPPRVGPANADGLEETDITSADVPVEWPPRPFVTQSRHQPAHKVAIARASTLGLELLVDVKDSLSGDSDE
jgi:hypothetical protein